MVLGAGWGLRGLEKTDEIKVLLLSSFSCLHIQGEGDEKEVQENQCLGNACPGPGPTLSGGGGWGMASYLFQRQAPTTAAPEDPGRSSPKAEAVNRA